MNETKKKKSLKGVTLVEIIISLAVVSVLTLLLVTTATTINAYIKSANHVNQKTTVQAPIAESGFTGSANELSTSDKDIKITVNGKVTLVGKGYSVVDPAAPADEGVGGNLNMKFVTNVDKEGTTEATTESTT
ncbi:prepilin-type N-terminal cleavage/methylation domain-containing protein [Ruminococcus sp.]|uniref:prepilin-type N-terminal cleavage/methylation domain-containing protein n=1 Tax=Ruminococcus sp. TaxID=41978 RepID=UPI0025E65D6C|nr:prepilin-type N-terminal cleavage/methylation domain-containing protein [Ruminococcus sp.]MCR4638438.1 prepilin-type N-terminal cleavage/methylation domain-containing protein [Ruminococcus sp.]